MHALSRIPYENLNPNEKELYNKLISELEYHPVLEYDLFGMDPTPILALDFKFADSGYGFVDWMMISPMITSYFDKKFDTNINKLIEGEFFSAIHEGTLDVGILFGNDWMNFSIMSTREEQGYGHTGNLVLGDNLRRQQFMRMHTFSNWFNYTYTPYTLSEDGVLG